MKYMHKEDEWKGLREKIFGIGKKEITARYSQEFVKEYSSHDDDSDFTLRKSHNTLTLTSSDEFSFFNSKELKGICDRVYRGKKNGKYYVVCHFNGVRDEFFVVNSILEEIAEMNKVKIKQDYESPENDLPQTTNGGRTLSDRVSVLGSEDIFYCERKGKGNDRTKLMMLSNSPFNFPRGVNGYDVGVKRGIVESNKKLFTLTYSLPSEVADVLKEPIIREIASAN